jgi:hypothetical protein
MLLCGSVTDLVGPALTVYGVHNEVHFCGAFSAWTLYGVWVHAAWPLFGRLRIKSLHGELHAYSNQISEYR